MEKNFKKCSIIGGMALLFWLLSISIKGLVSERSKLSEETQKEITESWSLSQDIVGPIICVPVLNDTLESLVPYTCMYILPERFEMTADLESEVLHRGIFDASVYRTKLNGQGTFNLKEMKEIGAMAVSAKPVRYDWENAQIIAAIKDKRGIEEGLKVVINGKTVELNQHLYNYRNTYLKSIFSSSLEPLCKMIDLSSEIGKENVSFEFTGELKGSSELNIAPIGQNSLLTMQGNCKDPSFNGIMLPSSRTVSENGFKAVWKVSSLNRSDVDQVFYYDNSQYNFQTVGTKLLVMGGQYTQIDRALKYAFLVILLSLVAVFVSEMCVKCEINFLSYILIGCALILFYLMLLSFGEWLGFSVSYFVSALMILGMITLYLKAIVKKNNVAIAVCLFMALVDVFIYILLSIASMALLVGTIGLFIILGVAMFFSLRLVNSKKSIVKIMVESVDNK